MKKILIFDWAGAVKLSQYGYEHNAVVEADLNSLTEFFLNKNLKVMISRAASGQDHDYLFCVDTRMFSQR